MKKETMAVMMAMAVALAFGRDTAIYSGKLTSAMNANGMAITNAPQPVRVGDLTRKGYVDAVGTDAVSQSKAYTDARIAEVGGVTAGQVTNISRHVASIATSNIVTKAYVEGLGISGIADLTPATNFTSEVASGITNYVNAKSGLNTNAVKQLIESETGGTNTILHAESDPHVAISNEAAGVTIYIHGESITPLTEFEESDPQFIAWKDNSGSQFAGTAAYATEAGVAGYANLAESATVADSTTFATESGHTLSADAATTADKLTSYDGFEIKRQERGTGATPRWHIQDGEVNGWIATEEQIAPVAAAVAGIAADYTTHLEVTNIVNEIADYAFTSSVTNEVAVAFNELLGEGWRGRFGGGLAGILAAIIAAIALLKSTKVGAFSAVGGQTPTVSNGTADLSSLFSSANTSNRYEMKAVANGTSASHVTLKDRAVNVWTVDTQASDLYYDLPSSISGRARDLIIAIDLTNLSITTAPTVHISGSWLVDGSAFPTLTTGKVNLLLISEMTSGYCTAVVKALSKV